MNVNNQNKHKKIKPIIAGFKTQEIFKHFNTEYDESKTCEKEQSKQSK